MKAAQATKVRREIKTHIANLPEETAEEEELEELPDISDDDVALDGPGDLDTPAAKRPKVE